MAHFYNRALLQKRAVMDSTSKFLTALTVAVVLFSILLGIYVRFENSRQKAAYMHSRCMSEALVELTMGVPMTPTCEEYHVAKRGR